MSVWRLLERPSLRPVWLAVHSTLERNVDARAVQLADLSLDARSSLQGLLGSSVRPRIDCRLLLSELDAALSRAEPGLTARDVVTRLVGPVVDLRQQRRGQLAADVAMWDAAFARTKPHLHPWLRQLQTSGHLKSAATKSRRPSDQMLALAVECASALPASGVLLQRLASEHVGDPHALDQNRPLAALVLRAAAALVDWGELPRSTAERRALWAEVGVLSEGHSSHVLVLGVRPEGGGSLARHLREQADLGRPRKVTLAELRAEAFKLDEPCLFLVENVTVLDELARRLGTRCPPVICLEGEPTVAVWELLGRVGSATEMMFHCDFDPAGVQIANRLHHRVGATPWHFDAEHYQRSVDKKRASKAIEGHVIETPWDLALAPTMRERGVIVYEEDVLDDLVGDLLQRAAR